MDAHGATYTVTWRQVPLADVTRYPDSQAACDWLGATTSRSTPRTDEGGGVFPPVVLGEDGTRRLHAPRRQHPQGAVREARPDHHTDAYIVTGLTDLNEAIYLSALFNAISGQPPAKDEIIRAVQSAKRLSTPDERFPPGQGPRGPRLPGVEDHERRPLERPGEGARSDHGTAHRHQDRRCRGSQMTRSCVNCTRWPSTPTSRGRTSSPSSRTVAAKTSEADRLKVVADERMTLAPTIQGVALGPDDDRLRRRRTA